MRINDDFGQRVAVFFNDTSWVASPMPGVERKMLDRIGAEVARATSIVRFAPGSAFSSHTHDGGEEYLVLDGTFRDEQGDFPTGSYVRNPPTSRHTPSAPEGVTILVKLHQFDPADRLSILRDMTAPGSRTLFEDGRECVRLLDLAADEALAVGDAGGAELFVLSGGFQEAGDSFGPWDWLRLPCGYHGDLRAGPDGARLWVKTGHLAHVDQLHPSVPA